MIVAVYARKSSEQRGVTDESKSVTRQVENACAFAAAKGWTVTEAYVFVDDGISGVETGRLASRQRMIDMILRPSCPFGAVVMQAQDRFSRRDGDEAFGELKQLARAGVEIWFYDSGRRFEYGTFQADVTG